MRRTPSMIPLKSFNYPVALLVLALMPWGLRAADEPAKEPAKDPAKAVIPVKRPEGGATIDFDKQVLPILKANCLACHNRTSSKGDLLLETPADILKGGESGPAAVFIGTMQRRISEKTIPACATGLGNSAVIAHPGDERRQRSRNTGRKKHATSLGPVIQLKARGNRSRMHQAGTYETVGIKKLIRDHAAGRHPQIAVGSGQAAQ